MTGQERAYALRNGDSGEKCKGANAASPRAKVQKWETVGRAGLSEITVDLFW